MREVPYEKITGRQKCGTMEKLLLQSRCIVLNWWLPASNLAYLKLMGPFAFIPTHKLWLHDKLSMYNYELWTMYKEMFHLTRIRKFSKWRRKTKRKNIFFIYLPYNSHFSRTKTLVLSDLKYIIVFLISLLFNEKQHLKVG